MIAQTPCQPRAPRQVPAFISKRYFDLAQKVRYPELRARIWRQLITEDERQRVIQSGGENDLVLVWARVKNVSLERAVIDLARKLNFLFPDEDQQLLEYIEPAEIEPPALVAAPPAEAVLPSYRDGQLWLGDELICQPRGRRGEKTRKETLFEAFETANWTTVINNPFGTEDQQYVHKAVQDANDVAELRFRTLCGGTQIRWEFDDQNGDSGAS